MHSFPFWSYTESVSSKPWCSGQPWRTSPEGTQRGVPVSLPDVQRLRRRVVAWPAESSSPRSVVATKWCPGSEIAQCFYFAYADSFDD